LDFRLAPSYLASLVSVSSTTGTRVVVGLSGGVDSSEIGRASCRERVCQYV